ncbi:MAG: SCP2 sterol-binding domain-containing protein [Candidatus Hodarchaeota archaeon]
MEYIKRLIEIRQKGSEAINIEDIPVIFHVLCDFININPEVQKLLEDYKLRMMVKIENGNPYNLTIEDKNAEFNEGALKSPDFIIKSNLKTISKLILGEVDPLEAYFSEIFKIEGDMIKVIKFVEILDLAFQLVEGNDNETKRGVIDANSLKDLLNVYLEGISNLKASHVPLFLEILTTFVNNNPEAKEVISEEDLNIQMKITDLDNYIIRITNNRMEWSKGEIANSDLILETDLETSAALLIEGNPVSAYMAGKIRIEGNIAKALIFQDLIEVFLDFINL